ncbi:GIY-YIG catalytic domain-containing endonuclease [Acanthocystis turfacea Chlorella virus TN603.4.2]|nr:GIY-YIG catalytic domain-containing endonuclease [Acanthocystis turfacea Chlorella virus TN603.4.2]
MSLLPEEQFILDNVMYWEAFRWERLNMGYIYIQKFSNGMMYAGLTTNLKKRMNDYKRLRGNNDHHTKALKKHIDTMKISFTQCPNYLLDDVEIFVIAFYDLTNKTKGYNKTTGGRTKYRHTKESRMKMSESKKGENHYNFGKTLPESTRVKLSEANKGEKNGMYGRTGDLNPFFGQTHTEKARAKMSEKLRGENSPWFGRKHKDDTRKKMSDNQRGGKNKSAKPICVFGKLYGAASDASETLREVCDTTDKGNFIKKWVNYKKHQHNVFYISKEFYEKMKDFTECITLDMYDTWINFQT